MECHYYISAIMPSHWDAAAAVGTDWVPALYMGETNAMEGVHPIITLIWFNQAVAIS